MPVRAWCFDINIFRVFVVALLAIAFSGCAGQRESYRSLLSGEPAGIRMAVGDKKEVLVVSDGFPGWWGYYPSMKSLDTSIAEVNCVSARSAVPFRKPGVILGGERCYVTALSVGNTWLLKGNKYTLNDAPAEAPGAGDRWVRLWVGSP